jgi:serine protease AprX
VAAALLSATLFSATAGARPANADLLGGLLGTVTGVVHGVLAGLTAGWDDGVTTPPTTMSQVTAAIGADRVWGRGATGAGIGIALIDSGVAPVAGLTTPNKVVNGADLSFESQSQTYQYVDSYGHGTHMAGIAAGDDGTAGGFKGVAPGAHIVSLKVATREGATDVSQVLAAIDWVVQHQSDAGLNVRVLSLSFGTEGLQPYQVDPLAFAVENAWHHGIVVVVSGGNDGTTHGSLTDPAVDPYVLAVGAANLNASPSSIGATVAPFSSRGTAARHVDVVAPGVSIASLRDPGSSIDDAHPSAVVGGRFFRGSGTSQATAVVAGAAALLLSAHPSLTPEQVKWALAATAMPLAPADANAEGAGMLDVNRASLALPLLVGPKGWAPATGTGSLEQSRGGSHVAENGVELTGEQDIQGTPWHGGTWALASGLGRAWVGGAWNGQDWTGSCWCTVTWAGSSWTGRSWTGRSWTGQSWTAGTWQGKSWTGQSWTGRSWTGQSWTGQSWTGRSWTSA